MEQSASLAIVNSWWKESLKISDQSNDALLSVITKSFETMCAVLSQDSDIECSMKSIAALDKERQDALLFENSDVNGLRHLVFGLIQSLQITLHQLGKKSVPPMKEPKREVIEEVDEASVSKEVKEELDDDSMNNDRNSSGAAEVEHRRKSSRRSMNNNSDGETAAKKRPSESVWYDTDQTTPQCVLCEAYPETVHKYVLHLNSQHKSTLKANGVYLTCSCEATIRSARCDADHFKNCDSREFSLHILEDAEPTTPQCIICGKHPRTILGYSEHLRSSHKATLLQNGIYLTCSCGLVVRTARDLDPIHRTKCDGRSFVLHSVPDATAPQCILCEAHPATVTGYADHLVNAHNTTLFANGIHLTCSCGFVVRSRNCGTSHSKKCTGLKFNLQVGVQ